MNNNLKYVATNMTMLFWVNEMITGAKLKKQGKTEKERRKSSWKSVYSSGTGSRFGRITGLLQNCKFN